MANKQYQSVIRLFKNSHIDVDAPLQPGRIKKQLTAEFDFSATGYIEADGLSYTKSDVLEELNTPDFEKRFQYHKRIWENPAILNLLEKNAYNYFDFSEQLKNFTGDEDFDNLFSPYFSVSMNNLMRRILQNGEWEEAAQLLVYDEFLLGEDREEAYKSLRIFLDDSIRTLRNVNKENWKTFRPQLQSWLQPGWSSLLNGLPAELEDRRNDVAFHFVNITVATQKVDPRNCRKISRELTCISHLTPELSEIIYDNHKVYTGTNTASGNKSYWWIGWVALILIRILMKC